MRKNNGKFGITTASIVAATLGLIAIGCSEDDSTSPTAPSSIAAPETNAASPTEPADGSVGTMQTSDAASDTSWDSLPQDGVKNSTSGSSRDKPSAPVIVSVDRTPSPDETLDYNGVALRHRPLAININRPSRHYNGLTEYRVQYWPKYGSRKNRSTVKFTNPGSLDNDKLALLLPPVPEGSWTFTVDAVNNRGRSVAGVRRNVRVTPSGTTVPGAVRDLTLQNIGRNRWRLSWKPPADIGGTPITRYLHSDRSGCASPLPMRIHEQDQYNPRDTYTATWTAYHVVGGGRKFLGDGREPARERTVHGGALAHPADRPSREPGVQDAERGGTLAGQRSRRTASGETDRTVPPEAQVRIVRRFP